MAVKNSDFVIKMTKSLRERMDKDIAASWDWEKIAGNKHSEEDTGQPTKYFFGEQINTSMATLHNQYAETLKKENTMKKTYLFVVTKVKDTGHGCTEAEEVVGAGFIVAKNDEEARIKIFRGEHVRWTISTDLKRYAVEEVDISICEL